MEYDFELEPKCSKCELKIDCVDRLLMESANNLIYALQEMNHIVDDTDIVFKCDKRKEKENVL